MLGDTALAAAAAAGAGVGAVAVDVAIVAEASAGDRNHILDELRGHTLLVVVSVCLRQRSSALALYRVAHT